MNGTQHAVAVPHRVYDDADRRKVEDLVQLLVLELHLLVNAVIVLLAAVDLVFDAGILQDLVDLPDDLVDHALPAHLPLLHLPVQFLVGFRLQVLKADVLHLELEGVDTESGRQRRIDVQGFLALFPYLLRGLIVDGPQVVQPVRQLDDEHADVFRHGQEHLADVLRLLFLLGLVIDVRQFGDAVHQIGDLFAEVHLQLTQGIVRILHDIVE